jgi:hypothetical protein
LIYFIATKINENTDPTTTKTADIALFYLSDEPSAIGLNTIEKTTRYLKSILGRSLKFVSTENAEFFEQKTNFLILKTDSRTEPLFKKISEYLKKGYVEEKTVIMVILNSDNVSSQQDLTDLLRDEMEIDAVCPPIILLHEDKQRLDNDYNKKKMEDLLELLELKV